MLSVLVVVNFTHLFYITLKLVGNSLDKLRHTRSVAYSAELVLLNKQQISGGGAYLDCYQLVFWFIRQWFHAISNWMHVRHLLWSTIHNVMLYVLCCDRGGSREPVTYTFRTKFGLAIVRCVRQADSQNTPPQSTVNYSSRRRLTAKLASCKLASASFGSCCFARIISEIRGKIIVCASPA